MIHLDTTFLVDLQREKAGKPGPATMFLQDRASETIRVSVHALCELEAGVCLARHPEKERARLHSITAVMETTYPSEQFVKTFAETYAVLERRGARPPIMDLLIAVAALVDKAPLVTRNRHDFEAIPDLEVLTY